VDREQRPAPTGNLTCPFRARVATQRLALDDHLDGRTGPVACDQPPVPSRDRVQRHTHRHQQPAGTLHKESTPSSDPDRPHPRPSGSGLRGSPSHDGRGWLSGAAAQAFGGSSTAFSQTGAGIRRGAIKALHTTTRTALPTFPARGNGQPCAETQRPINAVTAERASGSRVGSSSTAVSIPDRPLTCTNRPANRSRRPDLPAREPPVSRRGTNTAALTCSPTLTRLDRVLAGPMRSLCRSLRRWARRRRSTVPPVATSSPPERSAPP
jgi:hypothetical protein